MSATNSEAQPCVIEKSYISYEFAVKSNPFKGSITVDLSEYIEAIYRKNLEPSRFRLQHAQNIFLRIKKDFYGFNACYISQHFFQHLFADLPEIERQKIIASPVLHVLDQGLVEILKNALDSWIERYFSVYGDAGFDPSASQLVRLDVSVILDGEGIHVLCQDNGSGFSEDFLERLNHREQQLDYVRFGGGASKKKAYHPLREQYDYHHFGGRGLGLRQLMCSMLTHHINPQKIWSELSAEEYARVARDLSYEIGFCNGEFGGALIHLTSPLEGPLSAADDEHHGIFKSDSRHEILSLGVFSSDSSLSSLSDEAATTRSFTPVSAISSRASTPYPNLFVFIPENFEEASTDPEVDSLASGKGAK